MLPCWKLIQILLVPCSVFGPLAWFLDHFIKLAASGPFDCLGLLSYCFLLPLKPSCHQFMVCSNYNTNKTGGIIQSLALSNYLPCHQLLSDLQHDNKDSCNCKIVLLFVFIRLHMTSSYFSVPCFMSSFLLWRVCWSTHNVLELCKWDFDSVDVKSH